MNLFNWLLLGHLIGDWVLQSDWMAAGKKRGLLNGSGLAHVCVYTAAILGALWCAGLGAERPLSWPVTGAVVLLSHWLLDTLDVAQHWLRHVLQSEKEPVRVVVDQTLHLMVLAVLSVWLVR
jgi:hypothetical protein